MILSSQSIDERMSHLIWPFNCTNVQPASYDVTLGTEFIAFDPDGKEIQFTSEYMPVMPGEFILGTTEERIRLPHDLAAQLDGRSSWARKGLIVHVTAGWIDPGFEGQITLEITNISSQPIVLSAGDRIGQLVFHELDKPTVKPYSGSYQFQRGPRSSALT